MTTEWRYYPADLPSRYEGYEKILPESLDDLQGPAEGVVALPFRLAWSGATEFDLSNWRDRLALYQIIITGGVAGDPETFMNRDHVIELWPYMRDMFGYGYRDPWEKKFPELWYRASIDVSIYDPRADEPFQLKEGWMKRSRRLT